MVKSMLELRRCDDEMMPGGPGVDGVIAALQKEQTT